MLCAMSGIHASAVVFDVSTKRSLNVHDEYPSQYISAILFHSQSAGTREPRAVDAIAQKPEILHADRGRDSLRNFRVLRECGIKFVITQH